MKIFFYILLLLLANVYTSTAQPDDPKYTLGAPYKVIDGYQKYYATVDKYLFAVKKHYGAISIQKFNSLENRLISTEVYEDFPRGTIAEKLLVLGDKCYFFFNVWDKSNKREQLFCREINIETGKFKNKGVLLLEIEGKISYSPNFIATRITRGASKYMFRDGAIVGFVPKFDYLFSKDLSNLLIQYRKVPKIKRDADNYDVIGMAVYNLNLEQKWAKEVSMPYTEKEMDNLHYAVDKSGNAYTLAKVYENGTTRDKVKDVANYRIELLKTSKDIKNIKKITGFSTNSRFISKVWLYEGNKDEMICAGFYNNGYQSFMEHIGGEKMYGKKTLSKWTDHADGICVFKLNKDYNITEEHFHEIPLEILNQYEKQSKKNKNFQKDKNDRAQFENLELKDCIVNDDGSIVLIGEQNYTTGLDNHYNPVANGSRKSYSFGTDNPAEDYTEHYNDMLISKISPEGKLLWMRKLPKRQSGPRKTLRLINQGGLSFKHTYDQKIEQHSFLFLDNIRNIDLMPSEFPARHLEGAGGFLTCYKVDNETGKVSKHSIFDLRDIEGFELEKFYTHRITSIGDSKFMIEAYKGSKEDVLIKVETK